VAKPSPEFFARVVKLAGCEPDPIVYVGDRHVDRHPAPGSDLRERVRSLQVIPGSQAVRRKRRV
jgi:histidinol phosphatase-like enzyme